MTDQTSNTNTFDVVCIGAGPAGLSAAHELAKASKKVCVLEKDLQYVGGISRTVVKDGYRFDIGGHRFFSKSAEVNKLWREILGAELLVRKRKSRIYFNKRFFPYPLDVLETLKNLGPTESARCLFSYLWRKVHPLHPVISYRDWVVNQFGERLFQNFFESYTEKVWGISCADIAADWAQQRIKGLSFGSAATSAIKSALGLKGKSSPKSLIESFLYPRLGPGMFWETVRDKLRELGAFVEHGVTLSKMEYLSDSDDWKIDYFDSQNNAVSITTKHIVSSMPIKELATIVTDFPQEGMMAAGGLNYRDFLTVALILNTPNIFDDNWIYIHDPSVKVGRIQNFRAWSPDMLPNTEHECLGLEYFCQEGDSLWRMSDSELVNLACEELKILGILNSFELVTGHVVKQPKAYPVYDSTYTSRVRSIRQIIANRFPNLHLVGRNGMHKYNNQDHSMITGIFAARNIIARKNLYDVWKVNQDAEYHEES